MPQPTGVTGRVVRIGGQCLELAGAAAAVWNWTTVTRHGRARPGRSAATRRCGNNGWCATPTGGATAVGTKIVLDTCIGSPAQQWTAQVSGELVNGASNSCLDDPSNSLTDGTAQQLFTCSNGAVEQQYVVPPASKDIPKAQPAGPKGNITGTNGKCLVPADGTADVGAGIVVGSATPPVRVDGWRPAPASSGTAVTARLYTTATPVDAPGRCRLRRI
jgi:hypothetical protein